MTKKKSVSKMLNEVYKVVVAGNNTDSIDWNDISKNKKLSEDFIEENADKVNWMLISEYQKLSEPFIERHADDVYWPYISIHQKLSEPFIERHADDVSWDMISIFQKLSEPFIEKFRDRVDWARISQYQKLTEPFIAKYQHRVYWPFISRFQVLSEEFVEKFKDRVEPEYILKYQPLLSNKFKARMKAYWDEKEQKRRSEYRGEMSSSPVKSGKSKDVNVSDIDESSVVLDGVDTKDYPDFSDAYISYAEFKDGTPLTDEQLDKLNEDYPDFVHEMVMKRLH